MRIVRGAAALGAVCLMTACIYVERAPKSTPAPQTQSPKPVTVNTIHSVVGSRYTYEITTSDLQKEPDWGGPGTTAPPLSLESAVEIARRDLPRYVPDAQDWAVRTVSLRSFCCPTRWFYTVAWLQPGATGEALEIPVLLSGRTVPLTPTPDPMARAAQ